MKEILLTQGKVALVDDQDFDWLNQWNWCAIKSRQTFYACTQKGRTRISMHNLIMPLEGGLLVDHKDRNGLNNQRENLRAATNSQNLSNRAIVHGVSKYKGVSILRTTCNGKVYQYWAANIKANHKRMHLGTFKTEEEAATAYNKAAVIHQGEFAVLNIIPEVQKRKKGKH